MKLKKSSVAVACFLPGRAKDLSAPLYTALHLNWIFLNGNKRLDVSSCLTQDRVM